MGTQSFEVGEARKDVAATLAEWAAKGNVRRLWERDATLWTGTDEAQWLAWLDIVDVQLASPAHFAQVVEAVQAGQFTHAVVLGMGGSSLCPEVLRKTFGVIAGFPELHVLDSTVPAQVLALEQKLDLAKTLFIVSSKSGSTIEPNVFKQYFLEKVRQAVGADQAGSHFIAVTDPGTKMNSIATEDHFRQAFFGIPGIGGRFSALSNFGMVPAAAMGLDAPDFLRRAGKMAQACGAAVEPDVNPGVLLGIQLGTLAREGRDKVTIVASPAIASLGAWLEQLIAESTGKEGKGLVPVAEETVGPPAVYGKDRVFAYARLEGDDAAELDAAVSALEQAGHPVVHFTVADRRDLGQEFFRWEIATAVAGALLEINPFNQPDVEAAKIAARKLTSAYEATGKLPLESPFLSGSGLSLFADAANARELTSQAERHTPDAIIEAHLARIKPGDYFAINAYVEMNGANAALLQEIRHTVRDRKQVATTLGFGPRFLHSTGQLHKGGPNSGVFLQITSDDARDLPIPGQSFTFGVLKQAQAQGDFEVLVERQRRILRVHLGQDVAAGLAQLKQIICR